MKQWQPVTVFWISESSGGRPEPFAGERYSTMAFFPNHQTGDSDESWSVDIRFDEAPSFQGNPCKGRVSFLVEAAPHRWLAPGTVFELLEGRRLTAIGLVGES